MAIRINCPECKTVNRVDEDERGRRVRCRECDWPIRVPLEEDEAERPRRKKASSSSTVPILIGVGCTLAIVFFLCLGGAGVVGFMAFRAGDRIERARERKANAEANVIPNGNGKIILDLRGTLTANDPRDPTPELAEVAARMKTQQVKMKAGKTYVISLDSNDFDAYLRVESAAGKSLAEDDDSGGNLNARIVFRPTESGTFRIIATAWDGRLGNFHLLVQESD